MSDIQVKRFHRQCTFSPLFLWIRPTWASGTGISDFLFSASHAIDLAFKVGNFSFFYFLPSSRSLCLPHHCSRRSFLLAMSHTMTRRIFRFSHIERDNFLLCIFGELRSRGPSGSLTLAQAGPAKSKGFQPGHIWLLEKWWLAYRRKAPNLSFRCLDIMSKKGGKA